MASKTRQLCQSDEGPVSFRTKLEQLGAGDIQILIGNGGQASRPVCFGVSLRLI